MSFVAGEIKLNNSSIMAFGVGPDDKKQQHQYCSRQPNGNRFAIEIIILNQIHLRSPYKMPIKHLTTLFQLTGTNAAEAKKKR
jgi:putative endopeptidase